MRAVCSSSVNSCRHILPVIASYPPMPVSHASLIEIDVGLRKTMLFREMPFLA